MKPYDKSDYKRQVRFLLMETTTEDEVISLIEKHGAVLNGDEDMVKAFAERLNHIDNLYEVRQKIHLKSWNVELN